MILHRGIVPATLLAGALFVACIPENTRLHIDGSAATGGSGPGGDTGGSGGAGTGGSTGGSGGGSAGTGGALATGGSSGGADSGAPPAKDGSTGGTVDASGPRLDDINLNVLANCVFCHPGMAQKQSDFDPSDKGLYERLTMSTMDKAIPAACPIKTLIMPGNPMMSLIYLKVTGMQPASCGMRMPLAPDMKKPGTPLDATSIKMLKDWITAGAPR